MIYLVLEGPSFEAFRLDIEGFTVRSHPPHDDRRRSPDVRGQIGDAHASFAADLAPRRADDQRIEHHDESVTGGRLWMTRDVKGEGPSRHADLGSRQAHARGRRCHSVY